MSSSYGKAIAWGLGISLGIGIVIAISGGGAFLAIFFAVMIFILILVAMFIIKKIDHNSSAPKFVRQGQKDIDKFMRQIRK